MAGRDAAGEAAATGTPAPGALHLARWTVSSGSNVQSRGAVVIAAGDHTWEEAAEGNGPIDALFRAVDRAISEILAGHPRLLSYDIHALAEGPDAEGRVRVKIAPPPDAAGERGTGQYAGSARSTNIVAASIEAYIDAINAMLAEAQWAGAAETDGSQRRKRPHHGRRAEYDRAKAEHDTTRWFES